MKSLKTLALVSTAALSAASAFAQSAPVSLDNTKWAGALTTTPSDPIPLVEIVSDGNGGETTQASNATATGSLTYTLQIDKHGSMTFGMECKESFSDDGQDQSTDSKVQINSSATITADTSNPLQGSINPDKTTDQHKLIEFHTGQVHQSGLCLGPIQACKTTAINYHLYATACDVSTTQGTAYTYALSADQKTLTLTIPNTPTPVQVTMTKQ